MSFVRQIVRVVGNDLTTWTCQLAHRLKWRVTLIAERPIVTDRRRKKAINEGTDRVVVIVWEILSWRRFGPRSGSANQAVLI